MRAARVGGMSARTAVIAQPTFLPWSGWFDLADQADVLIILDDVGFSKQSWQQRNRIRTPEGLSYLTVPVLTSGRLGQRIAETQLANTSFAEKMLRTVRQNYVRAPHFARYFDEFAQRLHQGALTGRLPELNRGLIDWLAGILGMRTPRVLSSELQVEGRRGAHVALLCERVGANRYLSPAGAEEYLLEDRAEFDGRSIRVELHEYAHPVYRQCFEPFVPFASALDLVLNEGERSGEVMRAGRRPARPLGMARVTEEQQ